MHYRKLFLQHVLARIDECDTATDVAKVCLDACSDTWEEEFFDNLGQEDQGKEQDEETILSLEDIQLFLESRGVYKMLCKWTSGEFYGQFICCADSHCKQTTLHDFI